MSASAESMVSIRGVYAVWLRHFQVYLKAWFLRAVAPISEPIVYLVGFGYGLGPLVGRVRWHGEELSYTTFIGPGMMAVGVLFQSSFEGAFGTFVRQRFQRSWQTMLTAPLHYNDVFLGDLVWAATKGSIAGVATGAVAACFGAISPLALLASIPFIALGALLFGAFGMIFSARAGQIDDLNIMIFVFIVPMFALSGTYFPRDTLPSGIRAVTELLPLAPFVDLLRSVLYHFAVPAIPFTVTVFWTALFVALAWIFHERKLYK